MGEQSGGGRPGTGAGNEGVEMEHSGVAETAIPEEARPTLSAEVRSSAVLLGIALALLVGSALLTRVLW